MRKAIRGWLALPLALFTILPAFSLPVFAQDVVIGSKNFTENRLLAEILTQWIGSQTELDVLHRSSLGGTQICWNAMLEGQIDIYVEYTGTGWSIVLKEEGSLQDPLQTFLLVQDKYREQYDVHWLLPFGLNNTYAMALAEDKAVERSITRISDLQEEAGADLNVAFSIEFMNREDGWLGLKAAYPGLQFQPRSMEHGLMYEAVGAGQLDLIDAYSTDGKLPRYDLRVLKDDRAFFPPYNAAPLVRGELLKEHPELRPLLNRLAFLIDDDKALELNLRVEIGGQEFEAVAMDFLRESGLLAQEAGASSKTVDRDAGRGAFPQFWAKRGQLFTLLGQHLWLVFLSLLAATLIAIPLGVLITRFRPLRRPLLGMASVLQTIPSLALLAFLITLPGLGLGAPAAIVALVLYAILPILRNTYTGLDSVDPELIDAAKGMGLTPRQALLRVQFPLALRTILAGLRTAAVICVGIATLAAFIGAGGLGQPILEGLYLNDTSLILFGAIPAALMALAVDGLLGLAETLCTPRGLRKGVGSAGGTPAATS